MAAPAAATDLETLWSQLVEAVTRASRFTGGYLINAHPVSFAKGVFTIGFDPEFEDQMGLVDNARNHTLLQTKLAELGHPNSQIKFVKAEAPVGRAPAAAPVAAPASKPPVAKAVAATASVPKSDHGAAKGKVRVRPVQQRRFQERPAHRPGARGFQGSDRGSAGVSNVFIHRLNPSIL